MYFQLEVGRYSGKAFFQMESGRSDISNLKEKKKKMKENWQHVGEAIRKVTK